MSGLLQTQGKTLPDAWDYKGRPAERSKTGGWTAAAMILGLTSTPSPTHFYYSISFYDSFFYGPDGFSQVGKQWKG
jgi:hypothetical protein